MSDRDEIEQIRSSLEKLEKHVLDVIDDLHKRVDSLETGPEIVTDSALEASPIDNNEREHWPTEPPQAPDQIQAPEQAQPLKQTQTPHSRTTGNKAKQHHSC